MIGFGQIQYSDTLYKMDLHLNKEGNLIEFDEIILVSGTSNSEL